MKRRNKQLSNLFSTGGGGGHFEAHVQASFVVLMLTGGFAPGLPYWPITKIKLQGKFDGYDTDDMIVFIEKESGEQQRKLLGQIKHSISLTEGDKVFGRPFYESSAMHCLIFSLAVLILLFVYSSSVVLTPAEAKEMSTVPAKEPYSLSYAAGGYDASGNFLGGTEAMNLVAFQGKLYAGIGYWMDQPRFFPQHPEPRSGAQIIVLDAQGDRWRQETVFNQKDDAGNLKYHRLSTMQVIQFHRFDAAGKVLGPLSEMLVVGLDSPGGAVYTQKSPGNWEDTRIPTDTPIRSLAVHYDPADRSEKVYAGTGGGADRDLVRGIYCGVYDPSAPGRIRWNQTPEPFGFQSRVMSMVDCGGTLFAAAKPSILRRNDQTKSWEAIYSHPLTNEYDRSKYTSGFRGLTCISGPDGKTNLLSGFEGTNGDILRIDLQTGEAAVELDSRQFLTKQWGSPPAKRDIIAGYNDIPSVNSSPGEIRLFGLLVRSPKPNEENSAWLLSRTSANPPRYQLHEVRPLSWPNLRSDGLLWSVRTIAVSPFLEDQGQILYLGAMTGTFNRTTTRPGSTELESKPRSALTRTKVGRS